MLSEYLTLPLPLVLTVQAVLGGKTMFRQSRRLLHHTMTLPLLPTVQAVLSGKNMFRQSRSMLRHTITLPLLLRCLYRYPGGSRRRKRIRSFYLKEDAGKRLFSARAIFPIFIFLFSATRAPLGIAVLRFRPPRPPTYPPTHQPTNLTRRGSTGSKPRSAM